MARITATQLAEIAIIAKHLDALQDALEAHRQESTPNYSWGDGMWANVPSLVVLTDDGGTRLGRFKVSDFGYDWISDGEEEG